MVQAWALANAESGLMPEQENRVLTKRAREVLMRFAAGNSYAGIVERARQQPFGGWAWAPDKARRPCLSKRPDGELIVRYEGRREATQEPPPRMGALWAGATDWSPGPELRRVFSSVGDHHMSRSQQRRLAVLEPVRSTEPVPKTVVGMSIFTDFDHLNREMFTVFDDDFHGH
ncbi:MAG: hypothetical protein OXE87_01085 [Chloroflexi bacterium]|nr:hypothetical protein [Chloroflexota bacterium]